MSSTVMTNPSDVESMAETLEVSGDYSRAATEYDRASELHARDRHIGDAQRAAERARTCRHAAQRATPLTV